MAQYRPIPAARWCDDLEMEVAEPPPLTIYDDGPLEPTGLFDRHGHELGRVRGAIGFRFKVANE